MFKKTVLTLMLCVISLGIFAQAQNNLKNCVNIKHKGYSTMFDTTLKYPVLVNWLDTKKRVQCNNKLERTNKFTYDPQYKTQTNLEKDYTGSGYDRGHMCPAADNQCDKDMMTECFYFSNMAPQPHATNAGDWKTVEGFTRELSISYDSVYVWCGSVGVAKKINTISVPTKCWKVIYVVSQKKYYAYIMDNTFAKPVGAEHWAVDVSAVTKLTGFKFVP
jgi:endonuclease G